MIVYHGVVRGQVVVLPEDVQLDEGSLVEVRVPSRKRSKPARTEAEFKQRLLLAGLLREIRTPILIHVRGRRPAPKACSWRTPIHIHELARAK